MRRTKFVLAGIAAALAVSVAGSASASASEWFVGGVPLVGNAAVAQKSTTLESYSMTFAGVTITCTALEETGGLLEAPNGNSAEHLRFSGCKTSGACTVPGTIETLPVKSTVQVGAPPKIRFEPATGTKLGGITFSGAECSLKGNHELTGKVTFTLPGGETESVEHELATNSAGELKLGTFALTCKGKTKIKLTSGSAFSWH